MAQSRIWKTLAWHTTPMGVAVHALGITQIVAWGTTLYALAVLGKPIMAETGWSSTVVFGGLTLGLLISGVISSWVGRLIDRYGAKRMMAAGGVLNALGLAGLAYATEVAHYYAAWALLGVSMRLTLYDAAFAALVQVTPTKGRRAISYLTLYGGFASTVFWPIGHLLNEAVGWRETCLIFAALNLLVCAPLNWGGLARREPEDTPEAAPDPKVARKAPPPLLEGSAKIWAMVLFSVATSAYAFIFGAAAVHLVGLIEATGIATAAAVSVASIKGIAQVGGRLWDIIFCRNMAPLNLARVPVWLMPVAFVVLMWAGGGLWVAVFFTVLFGAANGLITIVRGAVPLAMFGAKGYGEILGILATPYLLINALSPAAFAIVLDWGGQRAGLWLLFGASLISLLAMEILTFWYRRHNAAVAARQTDAVTAP
ncbi:MAG: MFS transporter [Hyphomicrobiaceae bacterium]|nr:MFS transporter [Hyphomicrobiaceae bacterium]